MIIERPNPQAMPKVRSPGNFSVQRDLRRMESLVRRLTARVAQQEARIRELTKTMQARLRTEVVVLAALGMDAKAKRGNGGRLAEMDASISQLQDYLLKTGDRIESILKMLDTHREFLEKVNKKVQRGDNRDLMKMELDIMKNTITILGMGGVEFDTDLVADIDDIKKGLDNAKANIADLRRRKAEVSKKFEAELGRYDLESLYRGRARLPGYV